MRSKYFTITLAVLLASLALPAFAGKAGSGGTPLTASFAGKGGYGVSGDPLYTNAETSTLGCYFGVSNTHAILGTYNTGRTLRFQFGADATDALSNAVSLPSLFDAEVDFDGINQWGSFLNMGIGTTAGMKVYLQFYYGRETYELEYGQLAARRLSATQWILTTDYLEYAANAGVFQSSSARLNVIRRNRRTFFGNVSMPITFTVTLK